MALDEALLESAGEKGEATLRFYRWSEPTLSLGYFQRAADREAHSASRDCPLVRRASGGGAILHDAELTYSLAIPTADRWATAARGIHNAIHSALRDALRSFGVATEIFGCSKIGSDAFAAGSPFLCFQRRAAGDLTLGEAKIAGSAQRRHRAAVLQHGSVLLARSSCAPELPGIAELTGIRLDPLELGERYCKCLCQRFGWKCPEKLPSGHELPEELRRRAESILAEKFAAPGWNYRR